MCLRKSINGRKNYQIADSKNGKNARPLRKRNSKSLRRFAATALLVLLGQQFSQAQEDAAGDVWPKIAPYFQLPEEFAGEESSYRVFSKMGAGLRILSSGRRGARSS